MNFSEGKIHIYTGDGKGKTTAAMGLLVRARGAGKKCAIIFFDKGGTHYSERTALDKLGVPWFAFGRNRIDPATKRFDFSVTEEDHMQGANALEKVKELFSPTLILPLSASWRTEGGKNKFPPPSQEGGGTEGDGYIDLFVLDEFCTSVANGIISEQRALELINKKPAGLELILTGRNATPALRERADLVSVITAEKHYLQKAVPAREGIDW